MLIFCNIMLLLICCVLYWKMKGIEGKIKFHIVHVFCFSIRYIIYIAISYVVLFAYLLLFIHFTFCRELLASKH